MTRFSPEKNNLTPLEWSELAIRNLQENKEQFSLFAYLALALVLGSAASPLAGFLAGTWAFYHHLTRAKKRQANITAVIENGCIAHLLEGTDFKRYLKQVGREDLEKELKFADEMKLEFSNDALDYLEGLSQRFQESGSNTALQEAALKERSQYTEIQPSDSPRYDPIPKLDLVDDVTARISNLLIIGVPNSGKGILVANCIRELKKKHPQIKTFALDPKDDPKEHGYYEACDEVRRFPCIDSKPNTVLAWTEAMLREYSEFAQKNKGGLLIIDEGTLLGNKLKQAKSNLLADKIISHASAGDSLCRNIWFIAQSPFLGSMTLSLSATSQMTSVILATKENIGDLEQWKSSRILNNFSRDKLQELVTASPVGRAFYYGKTGEWYSMGKLPNYSSFNRDSREYLPDTIIPEIEKLEKSLNLNYPDNLGLSNNAFIVFNWLKENRPKQWVKYRGKEERDMTFINFLSDKSIRLEERDKIIEELVKLKKIILSSDNNSLMVK